MFDSAAPKISEYLLTGMHHSTAEARENIRLIIKECVREEFMKLTPSEFCVKVHQNNPDLDFSI